MSAYERIVTGMLVGGVSHGEEAPGPEIACGETTRRGPSLRSTSHHPTTTMASNTRPALLVIPLHPMSRRAKGTRGVIVVLPLCADLGIGPAGERVIRSRPAFSSKAAHPARIPFLAGTASDAEPL
jgi:hypothetical protein